VEPNLTAIKSVISKETCKIGALPPSAQAFLGCQLEQSQLWVVDHFHSTDRERGFANAKQRPQGVANLEKLADSFKTLCPEKQLLHLPPDDPGDMELQGERLKTLRFLSGRDESPSRPRSARRANPPFILLTTFQTLGKKLPTLGKPQVVKVGDTVAPDQFFQGLEKQKGGGSASFQGLEKMGYTLDVEVYEKGVAARRGGIIDLWPPTEEHPVRIEFFGDEIDSLRTFDILTQRSIEKISSIEILPLNAKGETTLEELLPENTLRILVGQPLNPNAAKHKNILIQSLLTPTSAP